MSGRIDMIVFWYHNANNQNYWGETDLWWGMKRLLEINPFESKKPESDIVNPDNSKLLGRLDWGEEEKVLENQNELKEARFSYISPLSSFSSPP